ncbi:MAG TPA: hypothetical protein QF361_03765 [Gammaproteobacteria bacterium]|nr:hypothetical protein [Gammaproteobacteria bacterium]
MTMKTRKYDMRFLTPAFLGNAEQSAQWRTPPIKALLRQWWRVVWAAENGFSNDIAAMRREEGFLFGVASDGEGDSRKSRIRLRLDRWDEGALKKSQWPSDDTVLHPEVQNRQGQAMQVGSALYQGFGPLIYDRERRSTTLKANAAIQAGESAALAIAWPTRHNDLVLPNVDADNTRHRLERTLALMHGFGTLGGRSRNGWGSFALAPQGDPGPLALDLPLRPWRDCLDRDWPHAIGRDDKGPLIWQTAPQPDWKALMKTLAAVKIGLRTQFVFTTGKNAPNPEDRHWLSYPVTNHSVQPWGGNARLPNSLRFKVRALPDGRLAGAIFHVPCLPPAAFRPDRKAIEGVWQRIYALLDELSQEKGKRAYASIGDLQRRTALKPLLDSLTLQRVQE